MKLLWVAVAIELWKAISILGLVLPTGDHRLFLLGVLRIRSNSASVARWAA